jgi:hypothetical protein
MPPWRYLRSGVTRGALYHHAAQGPTGWTDLGPAAPASARTIALAWERDGDAWYGYTDGGAPRGGVITTHDGPD